MTIDISLSFFNAVSLAGEDPARDIIEVIEKFVKPILTVLYTVISFAAVEATIWFGIKGFSNAVLLQKERKQKKPLSSCCELSLVVVIAPLIIRRILDWNLS